MDSMFRVWTSMVTSTALSVLKSTNTFERIPKSGTITAKELATAAGVHDSVITRSMRVICSQGIASEPEPDTYAHNPKSLVFITPPLHYMFDTFQLFDFVLKKLPDYLRTHSPDDFTDLLKSPFAYAHDREGQTIFEVISSDLALSTAFNMTMKFSGKFLPILGMYPFASLKEQVQAEQNRAFIVDVGGNQGETLKTIMTEAPGGFGAELVLQDRPDVLASVSQDEIPGITKMEHDFFTPQPVKNAHVYLLRRCLHDFYVPESIKIVKQIASAMGPTSRLIVIDGIIPEKTQFGADGKAYAMDFAMMILTGQEKTEKQFHEIMNAAGVQIVNIWMDDQGAIGAVEAKKIVE